MSKNYTVAARFRTAGIYSLLVVGAVIFCWPLLWLAFTSVKMDRELFTRKIHWIPEAPRPQMVAPYVDAHSFPDLDGPRQDELLPVLQSYFRPLAPALDPDLDPDALSLQLARGAYQHLSDNLPDSAWTQTQADLRKMALDAMNPDLTKDLLRQAERGVIIGPLSARPMTCRSRNWCRPARWPRSGRSTATPRAAWARPRTAAPSCTTISAPATRCA
jgi:ABC-type glycerol-3-phosphate transport system permease component